MDDHEFAEFVMRYVEGLTVEVSLAELTEGLQSRIAELSRWAEFTPLETSVVFDQTRFRYEVRVTVRVEGVTDLLHVKMTMDEAMVPDVLLVEEWDDFCDELARGVLMPALRVQTNRFLEAQHRRQTSPTFSTTTNGPVSGAISVPSPFGTVVLASGDTFTVTPGTLSFTTS